MTPQPAPSRRLRSAAAAAFLLLVTAALYGGRLDGPFLFDDVDGIVRNESIRSIGAAFSPPENTPMAGRPVPNLTLAANYAVGGLEPQGYHRFNLALHCTNALLAFLVVSGLLAKGRFPPPVRERAVALGFASALLWAVHPLAVEPVLYVTQRTESSVALFYLATIWAVLRSHDSARPTAWFAVAWVACSAGMASKAVMVTAPLLALFLDRAFLAGSFREALRRRRALYAGLALGWVVLALLQAGGPRAGSIGPTSVHYLSAQSDIVPRYLLTALTGHWNVLEYGSLVPGQTYGNWPIYLLVSGLVVAALILTFTHPRLGYAGAWVFGILAPTSSVVNLATEVGAERRVYLAALALVVVVVLVAHLLLDRWVGLRKPAGLALAVVLLAAACSTLGVRSRARTEAFGSLRAYWELAVEERPQNPRAHYNLGETYREAGAMDKALAGYEQALAIHPHHRKALVNLGGALMHLRRPAEAVAPLTAAVELSPRDFGAHYNLATALMWTGELLEARHHLERAVEIDPGHARARERLEELRALTAPIEIPIPPS